MNSNWRSFNIHEVWLRRNLATMIASREIKVRYRQSLLGFAWAGVRPLAMVFSFTYLFGKMAGLPSDGVPYPVYVASAMLAWDFFANIVTGCAGSVTQNRVMVERVYCPRILFPLSAVIVSLFDFFVTALVLVGLFAIAGFMPSKNIVYLPFLLLCVVVLSMSVGLWLAALAVWLRDVKYTVGYVLQFLLLLTPVGYGAASVPTKYAAIVNANPMATMIEAFRWCILGTAGPSLEHIAFAAGITAALLVGGALFFNSLERSFADVI
jgi:lipopolysaccharide transport system permease protein